MKDVIGTALACFKNSASLYTVPEINIYLFPLQFVKIQTKHWMLPSQRVHQFHSRFESANFQKKFSVEIHTFHEILGLS